MRQVGRCMAVLAAILVPGTAAAVPQDDRPVSARGPQFLVASSARAVPVVMDASRIPVLRRRIAVDLRGVTLDAALAAIGRESALHFVYGDDLVASVGRVHLRADEISIAAALAALLVDTGLDVVLSPGNRATLIRRGDRMRAVAGGAIAGTVTDAKSGAAIKTAEVLLEGTRWRASTDSAGGFHLVDVDTGTYTLTVRRFGYARQQRMVSVREGRTDTVIVTLEPMVTRLNELVTTATGRQRRLDIANDVTTINADSVLQAAPIRSLTDILEGRVPGLTVQRTTGAPGDPARLRLQGVGSVLRNNDPIVVVDGMRVYAEQSAARNGNLARMDTVNATGFTSAAPSPLDYIDPNSIETIEVLKGPSAATLYGPDAANGVIVVTTKRGRPGPARWTMSFDHGRTSMAGRYPDLLLRWGHSTYDGTVVQCPISGQAGQFPCAQDSVLTFQLLNDSALTVLDHGHRTGGALTVSGGTQALTYSLTGSYQDEVGLIRLPDFEAGRYRDQLGLAPPDWMRRPQHLKQWSATSAIGAKLGAKADVTLTATVTHTSQQKSSLQDQLGDLMSTYLDRSTGVYYQGTSNYYGVTETPIAGYFQRALDVATQFRSGAALGYHPRGWLTVNANAGLDVVHRSDGLLIPRGPSVSSIGDTTGSVSDGQGASLVSSLNLQALATKAIGHGFALRFGLGANYQNTSTNDIALATSNLQPGQTLQGLILNNGRRAESSNTTFGWYVDQSVGNQKFNLNAGLRLDGGSSYGSEVKGLTLPKFPKLGFSYLVSDEPWFPFSSVFQSFRVRVAYGKANRQPSPTDRLRLYTTPGAVFTDSLVAGTRLQSLGNTEVRPERSAEFEGGFDADLLDSRLSLTADFYRKNTEDALMNVPVAASVYGNGVTIVKNIGVIRNTGVNLTASVQWLRTGAVTWTTQVLVNKNRNFVVSLGPGVSPFYTSTNVGGTGGMRVAAGYPVFGRWSVPVIGYADANGDGVLETSEVQLGDTAVYVGNTVPEYTATLSSTVSLWHNVMTLNAQLSHDGGMTQRNETALRLAPFSDGQQIPGTSLSEQLATLPLNGVGNNPTSDYNWLQRLGTTRFQSFSVRYRVASVITRALGAQQLSVALQGSNLRLWTNYRGIDPNVNAFGTGNAVTDTGILPQPRTWQLQVNATY